MPVSESSLNLFNLVRLWEAHCQEAAKKAPAHRPRAEGGKATFDHNLARTFITCCYPRCSWQHHLT